MSTSTSTSTTHRRTVLITGCTLNSLGHHLALAFHAADANLHIIATARDISKLSSLTTLNITTLPLDVTSPTSLIACVAAVSELTGGTLDILINNAGSMLVSPLADVDIAEARACFDVNVWGYVTVTQAFLPLLLRAASQSSDELRGEGKGSGSGRERSKPIIANHTSTSATLPAPWIGIYAASKAAVVSLTDVARLELAPLGISVVEIKSGVVSSGIYGHGHETKKVLPKNSMYEFARGPIERAMANFDAAAVPAEGWARDVVKELLKSKPPREVSYGGIVGANRWLGSAGYLPIWARDMFLSWYFELAKVGAAWQRQRDDRKER